MEKNIEEKVAKKREFSYNYKEGERELTISLKKNGRGYKSGVLTIPMQWINELRIENRPKNIIAKCENGEIIIKKKGD